MPTKKPTKKPAAKKTNPWQDKLYYSKDSDGWQVKVVPSIDDFVLTLDNYEQYLKSDDAYLRNEARTIKDLLDKDLIDSRTGQPTQKYYPGWESSEGRWPGKASPEKVKQNKDKILKKESEQNAKAWREFDEKTNANARAASRNEPPVYKDVKKPSKPRPVNADSTRYEAQVPKNSTGSAKTETENTEEAWKRIAGQSVGSPTGPTGSTGPTVSGNNRTGGTGNSGTGGGNKGDKTTTNKAATEADKQSALAAAAAKYWIPESFFGTDPELKKIFADFVYGTNGKRDTEATFLKKLNNSTFKVRYDETARQRLTRADQYEKLLKQSGGNLEYVKNTPLAWDISKIVTSLKTLSQQMGASATDADLQQVALELYKSGLEESQYAKKAALRKFIVAGVDPRTGASTLTGQAAADQQTLFAAMSDNGFDQNMLSAVFGDYLSTALAKFPNADPNTALTSYILQEVADGKSIDDYTNKIRATAGMGYNDAIRNLLAQGVNLKAIANPYIQAMASTLEINPETLNVNDPTIRAALSADKSMNLYDFAKMLRKDDRWQYTKQARDETSSTVLQVLRDFGFAG